MKDKSKIVLIVVILAVTAIIAYVCYGITKGKKNPVATMEVSYIDSEGNEKTGTVKMELYPDVAPESVANFIALANNGYYDGLTFHRIAKDFVVQGGDKQGNGSGSANYSDLFETYEVTNIENKKATCKNKITNETKEIEVSKLPKDTQVGNVIWYKDGKYQKDITDYKYSIKGEFAANGINNALKFEKGIVGMARSDYSSYGLTEEGYNSASSQFFIVTTDNKSSLNSLNQSYASFGKVIEGYDLIEEISSLYAKDENETSNTTEENAENSSEENSEDKSEEENVPKMKSIRVETYGANYGLPNTINYEKTLSTVEQYQNYYQQLMNQSNSSDSTEVEGSAEVTE